jgi:hypothetical protein
VEKKEPKDPGPSTSIPVDANERTPLLADDRPSTSQQTSNPSLSAELV